MRLVLRIVIVLLYVLLLLEVGLWVAFGVPPLKWHNWYLLVLPIAVFVFWPARRRG